MHAPAHDGQAPKERKTAAHSASRGQREKKEEGFQIAQSQNRPITKLPNYQITKCFSVAVVIAVVPVVLFTPAALMLIPPAMMFTPAPFARLVQLATLVLGLAAVAAVPLNGFVQFMIPVCNAALAALHTLRLRARPSHEHQNSDRCRQRHE